jgi:hypothetical protein
VHASNAIERPASALPSTSFVCPFAAGAVNAADTAMTVKAANLRAFIGPTLGIGSL